MTTEKCVVLPSKKSSYSKSEYKSRQEYCKTVTCGAGGSSASPGMSSSSGTGSTSGTSPSPPENPASTY